MPGDYVLDVHAPRLDTLNTPVLPVPVHVAAGYVQSVTVRLATRAQGIAGLCPGGVEPGAAVVHGTVRSGDTGEPVARANVRAYWLTGVILSGEHLSASPHDFATFTDDRGRYSFCELTPTTGLTLRAQRYAQLSRRLPTITIGAGQLLMRDLVIAPSTGGAARVRQ